MTDKDLRKACDTDMAKLLLDVVRTREEWQTAPTPEARDHFEMALLTFDEKVLTIYENLRRLEDLTNGLGRCR